MNPDPFFPAHMRYGAITVLSEKPIGREIDSIMAEVLMRLKAVPIYDPRRQYTLCPCESQQKFTFFSRLTLRPDRIMGFSVGGCCYVNGDFLQELAGRTGGLPKYMAREGTVVHTATHELMHAVLEDAYGTIASRFLPEWKIEGFCEYGVNQYVAPLDSGYTIPERIDIYLDARQWNAIAGTHRPHYLWGLMMEYLVNVKGMSVEQVMEDDVTREKVYEEMMAWQEAVKNETAASVHKKVPT